MKLDHLYELRHQCNLTSFEDVSKFLNLKQNFIEKIYFSNLHGSIDISDLTNQNFENKFKLFQDNENEIEYKIETAKLKNYELVSILQKKRISFANLGTNKVKRRLNKLEDPISRSIRLALEIEDLNIQAKKYSGKYKDKIYNSKNELILKLIEIFEKENWIYGINKDKNNNKHNTVIYFEIPNCEQISWHFTLDINMCV